AALRPVHKALVEDDADAHIAAFEWNPPCPPAVAHEVIGGRAANAVALARPVGIFARELEAIPILNVFPPRPNRRGGMFAIGTEPAFLAREKRGNAGTVQD